MYIIGMKHVIAVGIVLSVLSCAGAPEEAPEPSPEETQPEPEPEPEPDSEPEPSPEETQPEPEPPMSETVGAFSVRVDQSSFSPDNADELRFSMDVADEAPVSRWALSLRDEAGETVFESADAGVPPDDLAWDGQINGEPAPEGLYTGVLMTEFTDGSTRTTEAQRFRVDLSYPRPEFSISNIPFTPDGDGDNDELIVTIDAEDASPIVGWRFEIRTDAGETLARFSGETDVPRTARWNGRSGGSVAVESGLEYRVFGGVRDAAGYEAVSQRAFPVGALTEQYRGRPRIILPRIQFPASSASIIEAAQSERETFDTVVDRVERILRETPDLRVLIEGHANSVLYDGPQQPGPREQREILLPLSRRRAEVVRDELVQRGIAPNRLETAGVGAAAPLVPFTEEDAIARNRRIELYVIE